MNPESPHASLPPAPFQVLLEDGPVLAINKPAGLLTLGGKTGVPTLERQVKDWLRERFQKPGNVYLGIPHRLDRPVSGVILFARNSKAASRLAEQFRERQVQKIYWGLTATAPEPAQGTLVDWLLKDPDRAHVTVVPPQTPQARQAILHYRTASTTPLGTLLEIELETGRMHQIRAQLGHHGWPILGDRQYGATSDLVSPLPADPTTTPIGLHARQITFLHPIRYEPVTIVAPLPENWGSVTPEEEPARKRRSLFTPRPDVEELQRELDLESQLEENGDESCREEK